MISEADIKLRVKEDIFSQENRSVRAILMVNQKH